MNLRLSNNWKRLNKRSRPESCNKSCWATLKSRRWGGSSTSRRFQWASIHKEDHSKMPMATRIWMVNMEMLKSMTRSMSTGMSTKSFRRSVSLQFAKNFDTRDFWCAKFQKKPWIYKNLLTRKSRAWKFQRLNPWTQRRLWWMMTSSRAGWTSSLRYLLRILWIAMVSPESKRISTWSQTLYKIMNSSPAKKLKSSEEWHWSCIAGSSTRSSSDHSRTIITGAQATSTFPKTCMTSSSRWTLAICRL